MLLLHVASEVIFTISCVGADLTAKDFLSPMLELSVPLEILPIAEGKLAGNAGVSVLLGFEVEIPAI